MKNVMEKIGYLIGMILLGLAVGFGKTVLKSVLGYFWG